MHFESFDYMAWAKHYQGRVRFDLSASGMPPPSPELFPLDPGWLSLAGATAELRRAVKSRIAEAYGVAPENVLLAAGASEANFLVCGALLDPGDRVLVECPAYQALVRLPTVFGASVDRFARDPDAGWAFSLEQIERSWQPGTRLLVFSTPHNPTCALAPPELLRALGEWLAARDAYALVDEVYRDFMPHAASVGHALHPRLITTSSLTKVYGLSALRMGWALAPEQVVARAEQLYDFMGVNPPTTLLHAALAAFDRRSALMARAQAVAADNRTRVAAWMKTAPMLTGLLPERGIISFLKLPDGMDAMEFALRLREDSETLVVPGDFFDAPGWIRIAYGGDGELLAQGLAHIRDALARADGLVKK